MSIVADTSPNMKTRLLALLTSVLLVSGAFGGQPVDAVGRPIPAGSTIISPDSKELKFMQVALCNGPRGDTVWIRADVLSAMSQKDSEKLMSRVCGK